MKGNWCIYKEHLFCQEESDCLNCDVYYATMPVPYDGRTVEEIEGANSRLFGGEGSRILDNQGQKVYSVIVDDTNGKFEEEL